MLLSSPISHKCGGQNHCFIVELVNRVLRDNKLLSHVSIV